MTNSFCIETPVPYRARASRAQEHVETHRPKAKVTYCHGKLLCPEEHLVLNSLLCAVAPRAKNFLINLQRCFEGRRVLPRQTRYLVRLTAI